MRRTRQTIKFGTKYNFNKSANSSFKIEQMFEVDLENPCEYIARTDRYRFVEYNDNTIVDLFECEPKLMVKLVEKKTGMLVKF